MKIVKNVPLPSGLTRTMLRIPIRLYRAHLGWLFGQRLLLLNHTGRVTGLPRQTTLEVVEHDPARRTYTVASGWGHKAAWYQNVLAHPDVTVMVGARELEVTATALSEAEGGEVFVRYAAKHRLVARFLLPRLLGISVDGSDRDFRAAGEQMPFVTFVPRRH